MFKKWNLKLAVVVIFSCATMFGRFSVIGFDLGTTSHVMQDGSHFHELHRLTPQERDVHRATLQTFLDHPSFHQPQVINHEKRYSRHFSDVTDEHGRKCILNYTLEHSEHHVFRALDHSDVLRITESVDGDSLTLFFPSEDFAEHYHANYSSIIEEGQLLMLTGSAKWGLRRSYKGVMGEVQCMDCSCHLCM